MKQTSRQPDYIQRLEELEEELVRDLCGLIRIPSVKGEPEEHAPFGGSVGAAFQYMLNLGKREDFFTENIDDYGGHIDFGPRDAEETMGVLCHLDVVPAGSGWDRDPFGGEVHDGVVWGRGTLDDKGPVMSAFYAMKALKDCGYEPAKRIRMILGLDEETGSTGMEKYKEKVSMPDFAIVPDGDFPLVHGEMGIMIFDLVKKFRQPKEGGLILAALTGGTAANMVPDRASAEVIPTEDSGPIRELAEEYGRKTGHVIEVREQGRSLELSCRGVSSHGAHPEKGINAISILMDFLAELPFSSPEVLELLEFYQKHLAPDLHGEALGCGLSDEISGKLILNVGMIRLNQEEARLTLNIRCPISYCDQDVYAAMAPVLEAYGLQTENTIYEKPVYFSLEEPLVQTLLSIYRRHTGDGQSQPMVIGGGTYAREMEHAIAFGALYPGDPDLMHQKNECVGIRRLIQTAKIYADAMYELAVMPEGTKAGGTP